MTDIWYRILTDIWNFSKIIFRPIYVEIFIFWPIYENFYFAQIGYFRPLHPSRIEKKSYIDQYNNSYIGLYKNVYKTLGDLAYIDLYTPYRFAASRSYIDRYMLGHLVFCKVIISTDIWIFILTYILPFEVLKMLHISIKICKKLSYRFLITISTNICFHISIIYVFIYRSL